MCLKRLSRRYIAHNQITLEVTAAGWTYGQVGHHRVLAIQNKNVIGAFSIASYYTKSRLMGGDMKMFTP